MARYATFSSPDNVKAKLQAALYYARKKRKARLAAGSVASWVDGTIVVGQDSSMTFFGYSDGTYPDPPQNEQFGSVTTQPNADHPMKLFQTDGAAIIVWFAGNVETYLQTETLFVGESEFTPAFAFYDEIENFTVVQYNFALDWSGQVGNTFTVNFGVP